MRFSVYSPDDHLVQQSKNGLSNSGRGSPKEHFCEIISKSVHWFGRRSRLKRDIQKPPAKD